MLAFAADSKTEARRKPEDERKNRTAQAIRAWLASKGMKRLRSDRRVGLPEKETLDQWAGILLEQGIEEAGNAEVLVDRAVAAANRSGQWRSWNFLTLQIQIAAERWRASTIAEVRPTDQTSEVRREEAPSDWKLIKSRIRQGIPEIAFLNWFEATRQVDRCGAELVVAVPDEPTAAYISAEYERIVHAAQPPKGSPRFVSCRTRRRKQQIRPYPSQTRPSNRLVVPDNWKSGVKQPCSYYAPYQLAGKEVDVRHTGTTVEIPYQGKREGLFLPD